MTTKTDGVAFSENEARVRFVRVLARGACSTVLEARRGETRLAVKAAEPDADPRTTERLRDEAKLLASLDHPNVVRTIGGASLRREPACVIMPLLAGRSLRDELAAGPLDPARARRLFVEWLRGLSAIHAAGAVHRDLKPSNLFIGREHDEPPTRTRGIVIDLGLAVACGGGGTTGPFVSGTPRYMAPEQWLGGRIDARTDVWALGVTLAEAVTGRTPRTRDALALDPDTGPNALEHLPAVAEPLRPVIERATRPRPRERFASAADFARALDAVSFGPSTRPVLTVCAEVRA